MTMNGINHSPPNLSGSVRGSIRIIKMGEAIQAPTPRPKTPYMVMLGQGHVRGMRGIGGGGGGIIYSLKLFIENPGTRGGASATIALLKNVPGTVDKTF